MDFDFKKEPSLIATVLVVSSNRAEQKKRKKTKDVQTEKYKGNVTVKNSVNRANSRAVLSSSCIAAIRKKDSVARKKSRSKLTTEKEVRKNEHAGESEETNQINHTTKRKRVKQTTIANEETSKIERSIKRKKVRKTKLVDDSTKLKSIAATILTATNINSRTIKLMAKRQNFADYPELGLAYFHLSSTHPDAFVFNDEHLMGSEGEAVCKRLADIIGGPVGIQEAINCQEAAAKVDTSSVRIAVCASCNEILFENKHIIMEQNINNLHPGFNYMATERIALNKIPADIIDKHISVIKLETKWYHLNPDLVPDVSNVVLCEKCYRSPRDSKWSIASGHDYGRRCHLPNLNETTLNAIIPVRPFNIDISLRSNHSTGHCICFPSDGPVEVASVLPVIGTDRRPQVTFLGPKDTWRKAKSRFQKLFEIDVEGAYEWLRVLKSINPYYENICIDDSFNMKQTMMKQTNIIVDEAVTTTESAYDDIMEYLDIDDEENNALGNPDMIHSTVLHKPCISSSTTSAIEALFKIVLPDDVVLPDDEDNTEINSVPIVPNCSIDTITLENNNEQVSPIVVVTREKHPLCEWDENDTMIAGAFSHLFMLGKGVPKSSFPRPLIEHLLRFYDARFQNSIFIAVLFNQLQRHACIRKTATISSRNPKKLNLLATLGNSDIFRKQLIWARDNPLSKEAKIINSKVCRILSMCGSTVPFSPFERASTRPKLASMRYRYGVSSEFITGAPPEFENLTVLRLCLIKAWNDPMCNMSKSGFKRSDLPKEYLENAGARIRLTRQHPAFIAQAYADTLDMYMNEILGCSSTKNTRITHNYLERKRGALLQVAAINGVSEPQMEGRLHWHMTVYNSILTPYLLTRLAAAPDWLKDQVGKVLDSLSCTNRSQDTHTWYDDILADKESPKPRAADIIVPLAKDDYSSFIIAAERAATLTGEHRHGFTCEKPPKGRYKCRLSMPRGVHELQTCPLMINLRKDGTINHRAIVDGLALDNSTMKAIDSSYSPLDGCLIKPHAMGPIVWELHRPARDAFFNETSLITTNLLHIHNNVSVINGQDAGEAVEEYEAAYMTKEGAPLRQAASILLAAIDDINEHPSCAEDTGTLKRTGKHLASRTVNAFSGAHQWSLPLMTYALMGYTSHITTEKFRYVFGHANVAYRESKLCEQVINQQNKQIVTQTKLASTVDSMQFVKECLDSIIESNDQNEKDVESCGGVTSYKINDVFILMSQAESYDNRGPYFDNYSLIEFECIVELLPKGHTRAYCDEHNSIAGRKRRVGFPLGIDHVLFKYYHGFIRTKMATPILAGPPPPPFPGNKPDDESRLYQWKEKLEKYANYILDLIVPWKTGEKSLFERSGAGLLNLIDQCDKRSAPVMYRGRFRYLHNMMSKAHRSSHNERATSAWRERNTDWWCDLKSERSRKSDSQSISESTSNITNLHCNGDEACGKLCTSELYNLTVAANNINESAREAHKKLRETCTQLMFNNDLDKGDISSELHIPICDTIADLVYQPTTNNDPENTILSSISLSDMRDEIHALNRDATTDLDVNTRSPNIGDAGPPEIHDASNTKMAYISPCFMSNDQYCVVNELLNNKQQLIIMLGGGGVGKTTAIIKIIEEHKLRGNYVATSSPTGVGASHLPHGNTVHALFKTFVTDLNAGHLADEIYTSLGGIHLALLVIDEVSMLYDVHLCLIDARLRALYDPDCCFGGISILLSGDFLQLPAAVGTSLYKIMYGNVSGKQKEARALFAKFRVMDLTTQLRAANCPDHCRRLLGFRALPTVYPEGVKWSKQDNNYKPMSEDIIEALTCELTTADITTDQEWITNSICLTTSNVDRAIMNSAIAIAYGRIKNKLVIRWNRMLQKDIPLSLKSLLFSEDDRPELFAYFVNGAPGQILDNGNGNVTHGVANGTPCQMVCLAWTDPVKHKMATALIGNALKHHKTIIHLSYAPDFIVVHVEPENAPNWPSHLNLSADKHYIHIPIGIQSRKQHSIRVDDSTSIAVVMHAIDLAFAVTVWKCQGGTYSHVIAMLEHSPHSPSLSYELLYVMYSRVTLDSRFKCFPLSLNFRKSILKNYKPNIFATKWRLDIGPDGYWNDNSRHRCTSNHRVLPKATVAKQIKDATKVCKQTINKSLKEISLRSIIPSKTPSIWPHLTSSFTVPFLPGINFVPVDFESLLPGQWLTDNVIDSFACMHGLSNKSTCFILPSSLYTHWNISHDLLANWWGKNGINNTQMIPMWIIPLCEQNHWQLVCVLFASLKIGSKYTIYIMDSLIIFGLPSNHSSIEDFVHALIDTIWSNTYPGELIPKLAAVTPCIVQLQPNNFDCGVFTILNMINSISNLKELIKCQNSMKTVVALNWYTVNYGVYYRLVLQKQLKKLHNKPSTCALWIEKCNSSNE